MLIPKQLASGCHAVLGMCRDAFSVFAAQATVSSLKLEDPRVGWKGHPLLRIETKTLIPGMVDRTGALQKCPIRAPRTPRYVV